MKTHWQCEGIGAGGVCLAGVCRIVVMKQLMMKLSKERLGLKGKYRMANIM